MKGRAVCALFVLVSFAFLEADAKKHSRRLESKGLDRKRRSLLDNAMREEVVKTHNDLRRLAGSSNMKLMRWNDDLEEMAGAWVEKYTLGSDGVSLDLWSALGYDIVGQNFHATSEASVNFTNIMQTWYDERFNYNFDTGECSPNNDCAQYTQMVRAESRMIGCAYTNRDTVVETTRTLKNVSYFVCKYAPGGNYKGKKPYKKGPPCTECASKTDKCNAGLCDGG